MVFILIITMILDNIQNHKRFNGMHPGIIKALNYIKDTNFATLKTGKHDIEGEALFAIYKEYETTPIEDKLLESHLKYVDVQYVVEGVEQMAVTKRISQFPKVAYDTEQDFMLFDASSYDVITVSAGMFVIFFPDDLHMPEITTGAPSQVKKIVVKVKIKTI